MKRFFLASALTMSLCSVGAFADQMTGYISDAHCGAAHSSVSDKNTHCVVDMCIKGGSDPVLVSDGKVIKFTPDTKEKALPLAGKEVKIDGTMDGDLLKISAIQEAK